MGSLLDTLVFPLMRTYSPKSRDLFETFEYDGNIVYYYLIQLKDAQSDIIYFHGNIQQAIESSRMVQEIAKSTKSNLYILQYPNYGVYKTKLRGSIEDRIKADAKQLFNHLVQRKNLNVKNLRIIGRSIGSGPAAYLASQIKAPRLILISPITTVRQVVSSILWFIPVLNILISLLFKKYFDNYESLRKFNGKLLVIHGEKDEVVPINLVKRLVQSYIRRYAYLCYFRYPKYMTHNEFDHQQDIVQPITDFINEELQQKRPL